MDKKCSKCGEIKPIDLFQTDNTKPDKHRPECKSCSNKPRSFYEKVDKKVCQRCKVEKKIEDKYYLKKGLVGLLNYINAKGSTDQKVYGK